MYIVFPFGIANVELGGPILAMRSFTSVPFIPARPLSLLALRRLPLRLPPHPHVRLDEVVNRLAFGNLHVAVLTLMSHRRA